MTMLFGFRLAEVVDLTLLEEPFCAPTCVCFFVRRRAIFPNVEYQLTMEGLMFLAYRIIRLIDKATPSHLVMQHT